MNRPEAVEFSVKHLLNGLGFQAVKALLRDLNFNPHTANSIAGEAQDFARANPLQFADVPKEDMQITVEQTESESGLKASEGSSPERAEETDVAVADAPEWITPAHEEIDLATADPSAMGLDPMNETDARLMDAITEAKRKASFDPLPAVPDVLKQYPNWVTYKDKTQAGKAPIISGTFRSAKSDDPTTWVDYKTASANIAHGLGYANLGFVTDGERSGYLTGVDIDGCKTDDGVADWVGSVLDTIGPSYTEWTPNNGLRVWIQADFSKHGGKKKYLMSETVGYNGKAQQIEVFGDGLYFTVTGNKTAWSASGVSKLAPEQVVKILGVLQKMNVGKPEKPLTASPDGDKIPFGQHDNELHRIAGKLRHDGLEEESIYNALVEVCEKRCEGYGSDYLEMCRKHAHNICKHPVGQNTDLELNQTPAQPAVAEPAVPIIDDPADDDTRFRMTGETFDTKVYEDMAQRFTVYPDPGEGDLISLLAKKLVTGTSIPLAYVREPLKAMVLHALDGKLAHPAHKEMSLRGNYFSLGESESGKTTGLEFAMKAANLVLRSAKIYAENLFRYKSETTFIRSFTPEGTQKRDAQGEVKSGRPGNPSQFLYIKEGNLVANCSDYFGAVFSQLTNLYDQTEAGTESMTNGDFTAGVVKASTVMCFTPTDYKATFGGKGTIGGGGLNRWGATNPPEDHSYDDRDWERLDDSAFQAVGDEMARRVFQVTLGERIVLQEEPGAQRIRLEVKSMLKKAGKVGKRLLDYFMREQVAQAAVAVDDRLVMTTQQARYAKRWVMAQLQVRLECWPADTDNKIVDMEHAIRKEVNRHFVSETKLKDACNYYRETSGGWFVFNAAIRNARDSEAIKLTAKTQRGVRAYCPGSCGIHPAIKEELKSR